MGYASAAFRTALDTRLDVARTDAVGTSRMRKRVVFERLLARLQQAAPGAWVLEGGFAPSFASAVPRAYDKDIDVDWKLDEEDAVELLIDAARLDLSVWMRLRR